MVPAPKSDDPAAAGTAAGYRDGQMTVQLSFLRAALAATAAAAVLSALPVQTASAAVPLKSDRGSLRVQAQGVPQGRTAKITVARKDWRKKVRSAGTLRNLRPGTYKVWASPIVADGGTAAVPNLPVRVRVPKRRPATLSLQYQWSPKTDPYPPGPVSGLAVSDAGPRTVSLRWDNSVAPDLAGVQIRRKPGGVAPTTLDDGVVVPVPAFATSVTDVDLRSLSAYSYSVFMLDTAGNASPPVSVSVSTTGQAASITAGTAHSCAVLTDGAVACWGANDHGQLGNGTTLPAATPQLVGIDDAVQVVAGDEHTCARLRDQSVWCWGRNDSGQLGDGSLMSASRPVRVALPASAPSAQIIAGGAHTCAVSVSGALRCWGNKESGQAGVRVSEVVVPGVTAVAGGVSSAAAGWAHTCFVRSSVVRCFGENEDGQLGSDGGVDTWIPVADVGITKAVKVTAGVGHTCALLTDRTVQCWGMNSQGQLGDGTTVGRVVPQTVTGTYTDVVAGAYHSCALTDTGARCWGRNTAGRLGDGTTTDRPLPARVALTTGATQLAAGGYHTCALAASQTWCWGANALGQAGLPFSAPVLRPTAMSAL